MSKDLIYLRDKDSNNPIAVKAGDLIFIAGQMAFESEIGVPDSLKLHEGMPHHGSLIEKQSSSVC